MARGLLRGLRMVAFSKLKQAVAVGCLLSLPHVAVAAAATANSRTPEQRAAHIAALRTAVQQHDSMAAYLGSPLKHSVLHGALAEYQAALGASPGFEIATNGQVSIVLHGGRLYTGGNQARVADLKKVGLTTPAQVEQLLRKHLEETLDHPTAGLDDAGLAKLVDRLVADSRRKVATFAEHPDLQRLAQHHRAVTAKIMGTNYVQLLHDVSFEVSDDLAAPIDLRVGGLNNTRPLGLGYLKALNFHTPTGWNTFMARNVMAIAGVEGDATSPQVVADARQALLDRAAGIPTLERLGANPSAHPDMQLLRQVLRIRGLDRIELKGRNARGSILYYTMNNTFAGSQGPLVLLAHAGIHTPADFTEAIQDALMTFPVELSR